jgi:SAM-dependent methyltransferase
VSGVVFVLFDGWLWLIILISLFYIAPSLAYDPYPYNPSIHIFGNHGFLGKVHAEIAPVFTRFTDNLIYGKNVRYEIIDKEMNGYSTLDIGCGVGFSTSVSNGSVGLDASTEMIEKGRTIFPEKEFIVGHGEHWEPDRTFDVVSCMFMFHEVPMLSRKHIIKYAKSIAKNKVVIVDISPNYVPSKSMLLGEPYLLEYIDNINDDLHDFTEHIVVDKHVHMWIYKHVQEF